MSISRGWLDVVQALVAFALLALSFATVPGACLRAWRYWTRPVNRAAQVVVGALVVALLLRLWIAPLRLAMVFVGYKMTEDALHLLPISRYGAGAASFYHALFAVLPWDHASLMRVNSIVAVLAVPIFGAFVGRLFHDRRAGALAALLAAAVPMFVRNDTSESNHVPCLFWFFAGLVLWQHQRQSGSRVALWAGVQLLVLAAISRPEMPVLVVVTVALLSWAERPGEGRRLAPRAVAAAVLAALLALPHVAHVARSVAATGAASLPGLELESVAALPVRLVVTNALLRPALFPCVLLALALASPWLVERARRRQVVAIAVVLVTSLVVYSVDADDANIARVHVPAALFACVLAAAAGSALLARGTARPALVVAAAVAVVASAVPTVRQLWRPTNEETEERWLRAAARAISDEPFALVRPADEDEVDPSSPGHTHFFYPDYLFRPPVRPGIPLSIAEWHRRPDWSRPAYFFWGMRCYARFRPSGTPAPKGDRLSPACASMRANFRLEPLREAEVPNHGDVWIGYYGDAPTLRMGIYRVLPRAP